MQSWRSGKTFLLRSLKKIITVFVFSDLLKGGLNHIIVFSIFPCFYYFLLVVDTLIYCYIHSWRDVAHNVVLFLKTLLLMITVISPFQWTTKVAWL